MLVELGVVEQRHRAVLEVLVEGTTVTEVAGRLGVTRQSLHRWLRRYASQGLVGLANRPPTPESCPHQMPPAVEAAIQEMRGKHPGWGPRTIAHQLDEAHLRRAAGSETGAEEILDRLRGQEQRLEEKIADWREWRQEHRADLDRLTRVDSLIGQRDQHHDRSLDRHPQPSRGVERDLGLDLGL